MSSPAARDYLCNTSLIGAECAMRVLSVCISRLLWDNALPAGWGDAAELPGKTLLTAVELVTPPSLRICTPDMYIITCNALYGSSVPSHQC
jgi:hypothetical protein